jgi:hypothetical protein
MMHLLFATSIVPDGALASGYEIATAALVDGLRRAGHRVTVLGFTWPGKLPSRPEETIVLGSVDVRNDSASFEQRLTWLAKAVRDGLTVSSVKLRLVTPGAVRAAIDKAGPFDAYVLNAVQFAGAFEELFKDRPTIFAAHNVENRSARESAEAADGAIQRFLFRREARLLKEIELRLCRNADFVFTLAEEDRIPLGVGSDERSAVLPLVFHGTALRRPDRHDIACDAALIGTWTWQPNRIGLEWFLNSVVPHLKPDFRIRIAGSVPSGVSSPHPGVEFVGRVPDAEKFVASAAVIPLVSRAGSGVQLKTIETFELGLPSVATTSSLRGIRHVPENCVVTDDPMTFARALEAGAREPGKLADGAAFHRRQLTAFDEALRIGLSRLGSARREAAA